MTAFGCGEKGDGGGKLHNAAEQGALTSSFD